MADFGSVLPFPRGKTFRGGDTTLISSTPESAILGKVYVVEDTEHGTRRHVKLRVVKNQSGSSLAAKKVVKWNTSNGSIGRLIAGVSTAVAELVAGVVDDAYGSSTIADDDVFYIVVGGPCDVVASGDGDSFAVGDRVVSDDDANGGRVRKAATAAAWAAAPLGICDEATSTANATFRIIVTCDGNSG